MQWLNKMMNRVPSRAWFAGLALGSVGLVAVGLQMQAVLRLSPCPLCIFQRVLYLAIGVVALLGALLPAARLLWGGLIVLTGLGGAAVAGYQSWMQAFPQLATECGYTDPNAIERLVDWLGMRWPSLFLATGFCTSREWEFLGLSMANWSALVFAGFAAFGVWLVAKKS
jgi:disulfide bond formation protein DsbB